MNKIKLLFKLILGFITTLILIAIVFCLTLKLTIFNKEYILKTLDETDYYNKLTLEIQKDMEYSLLSSGLDKTILTGLVEKTEVKTSVLSLIDSIYSGNNFELNSKVVAEKINTNIDNYLKEKNITVVDKNSLNAYTAKITDIYEKEISLYGYLNNLTSKFVKIGNLILIMIPILTLILIINLFLINKKFGSKYSGVTMFSAGLIILFIKFYVLEKIDIQNILLISESFSKVIKKLLTDIDLYILISSILLIVIGVVLNIINSFRKKKKRHKE